jgi:hypothetical protein
VFTWVGQVLGAIAVAVLVIGFFILLPGNHQSTETCGEESSQNAHVNMIRSGELLEQKEKMIQNRAQFKQAKAKIKAINPIWNQNQ